VKLFYDCRLFHKDRVNERNKLMFKSLTRLEKFAMEQSGVVDVKRLLFLEARLLTCVDCSSLVLLAFSLAEA
jgi:hypothetical protein